MSSSLSRWECFNILGIPSTASQDEIRQAYRTKALDNHPDKNQGDPRATERFQRISQAYRVLASDNDTYGDDSDSDNEFGGGLNFMYMYFRMFEEMMRREEARRRQPQSKEEYLLEQLFGLHSRHDHWQEQPHRRREPEWSPPRRTTQQTWGRNSQQTSGRTSQQTSGRTSQQTSGRTSQQTNGRTSQQTSGRTSQQTSGRTSQQTSGRTSQQTSWKSSHQTRGRTSQQTSGRTAQQTSGRTSQQTGGNSAQQRTQRSKPLTRKNGLRPSKENEAPRGTFQDGNSYTSFQNQQEESSKVSDDEGSKHKPSSDSAQEQFKCTHPEPSHPMGGELNTEGSETKPHQSHTTTSSQKHKATYEKYQPKKLSKKQLLAQQKRRAKEAEEIGKEIRKKTELMSKTKSS